MSPRKQELRLNIEYNIHAFTIIRYIQYKVSNVNYLPLYRFCVSISIGFVYFSNSIAT